MCDWGSQNYKRRLINISSSGVGDKACAVVFLMWSTLFKSHNSLERQLFSNKNEKVENKVSGRVRVELIWIKMVIYTQYFIIACCFIMYYNTEYHYLQ